MICTILLEMISALVKVYKENVLQSPTAGYGTLKEAFAAFNPTDPSYVYSHATDNYQIKISGSVTETASALLNARTGA